MRLLLSRLPLAVPVALAALSALVLGAPKAHAQQATLAFTGGNNTPLTLTLANPVSYTLTANANQLLFVFSGVGDFIGQSSRSLTGSVSYTINGGPARNIQFIQSGFAFGSLAPNDAFIFDNPFVSASAGDAVVLTGGMLTTDTAFTGTAPAGGTFQTFIARSSDGSRVSAVAVAAPEPGSLSLLGMGLVSGLGMAGTVRRKRRKTGAAQTAA